MPKLSLLIILIIIASTIYSQDKLEITALNRITLNRKDTIYQFFVQKAPEKLKVQTDLDYYWFAPDTILVTTGGFDGKLLHGGYKVFYPNKNLKEEGSFDNGSKTGVWRRWDPDGRLLTITNWNKGKKEGPFTEYGPDGKIINNSIYKDGKIVTEDK